MPLLFCPRLPQIHIRQPKPGKSYSRISPSYELDELEELLPTKKLKSWKGKGKKISIPSHDRILPLPPRAPGDGHQPRMVDASRVRANDTYRPRARRVDASWNEDISDRCRSDDTDAYRTTAVTGTGTGLESERRDLSWERWKTMTMRERAVKALSATWEDFLMPGLSVMGDTKRASLILAY